MKIRKEALEEIKRHSEEIKAIVMEGIEATGTIPNLLILTLITELNEILYKCEIVEKLREPKLIKSFLDDIITTYTKIDQLIKEVEERVKILD